MAANWTLCPVKLVTADISARARATSLVRSADTGSASEASTLDALVPLIYNELQVMAHRQLERERHVATLQTTELVHEVYLRLVDDAEVTRRGRAYFFAAASRSMRRVLVDRARRRSASKRGSGRAPEHLLDLDAKGVAVDGFAADLLDLDGALERLATLNARQASVVECRYFGGLDVEETAESLGISPRTVKSDWAVARAWLYAALRGHD